MSTLSKVFVILIVVASFVYLGVTSALFAHRVNWKDQHEKLKAAAATKEAELRKDIETKSADLEQRDQKILGLENDRTSRTQLIEKLEVDNKNANMQNQKMVTEISGLRNAYETLKGNLDEANKRNESLQDRNAELQKEKDQAIAERDNKQNSLKETESRLTISERNLADLEKQYIGRMKELDEMKTQMNALVQAGVNVEGISKGAKKPVDARVIAVSDTMNLLIISAGRDSGVEPGMEFTVYRGDKFIGKAVVEKADKDWSSCRSVKEFEVEKPSVGDAASSKVY